MPIAQLTIVHRAVVRCFRKLGAYRHLIADSLLIFKDVKMCQNSL